MSGSTVPALLQSSRIIMHPTTVPSGGNEAHKSFYLPELDVLRFFAALLVIIHHAPTVPGLASVQAYGWIGVDLFLCLSAYLLTTLLRLEFKQTGTIRLRAFFIRRALRIWPLYFGFAGVFCALAVAVFDHPPIVAVSWFLSHLTFSANLMTALAGFSLLPFTNHLWTISLEEQAYFVIPIALFAFSQKSLPTRAIVIAMAAALATLYVGRMAFWFAGVPTDRLLATPLRADGIIYGVAAALLVERLGLPSRTWCFGLLCIGLAMMGMTQAWDLSPTSASALLVFPFLTGTCLCAVLGVMQTRFRWSPLVYLGKVSFGIYIYHTVAIRASERLLERAEIVHPAAVLALTVILACLAAMISYKLLETPFLRLKERFTVIRSRPV